MTQAGTPGTALERTQERVDLLIRVLSLTQAEWQARCAELAEEAQRARAEGRAQALAEVQEHLRAAELRVMKAQRMMREAEQEREKTEALLTQAQRELALRRRAQEREEEEKARRREAAWADGESAHAARLNEEGEQFTQFLERAEAELGAVRADLRSLGEELPGHDSGQTGERVIEGQWTRGPAQGDGSVDGASNSSRSDDTAVHAPRGRLASNGEREATSTSAGSDRRTPVPGPPRRFLIGVAWALCAIPPWFPMLVVTSNRTAYASDSSLWAVVPFTLVTVIVGAVAWLLSLLLAGSVCDMLNRDSESGAVMVGCAVFLLGSLLFLVLSFWTPLTWPGPAGAWGQGLASAVGLG